MKTPNMQLFLDRFISVNRVRFKDYPKVVDMLNHLKLDDVHFEPIRSSYDKFGELVRTTDMYVPKMFKSLDQSWLPAYYTTPRFTHLVTPVVQEENKLITLTTPGIYTYSDRYKGIQGCVVVGANVNRNDIPQVVKALIKANCDYQIDDNQISLNSYLLEVTVDTPTIYQRLKVILSMKDTSFVIPETDYGYLV